MGIFDGFRRKRRVEEEAVASTSADRHEDRPDETGHDEPRRGPRPRVKTSPAPFGPVGLLAIQFQGCRVLVSTKTDLVELHVPYWTHQRFDRERVEKMRIEDDVRNEMIFDIIASLFRAEADAVSVQVNGEYHYLAPHSRKLPDGRINLVRGWWD